jgi:hypothetical protein
MNQPEKINAPGSRIPPEVDDDATGLPWPRSWRGVYAFVITCFVVTAGLLAWLTFSSR